jgi:hypothetical protein
MLSSRYMVTTKNLPAILQKIVEGAAPEKFTVSHLKGIGFTSSNDQGVLPLLKDLKFLTADGAPPRAITCTAINHSQSVFLVKHSERLTRICFT